MKLRILSDLHLEYCPFEIPPLPDDSTSTLVLAGDIGQISQREILEPFLRNAAARFSHVIYVMGNHEYYEGDFPDSRKTLRQWQLPANLHVLENTTIKIDDITFAGTTLWTDFYDLDPDCLAACLKFSPDFIHTQYREAPGSPEPLTPEHQFTAHHLARRWISATLASLHARNEKTVLVTHHGISPGSIHPKWAGQASNGGFISDLESLILAAPPMLCIHGHSHDSFDYRIGTEKQGTRVVTNPRGVGNADGTQENNDFNSFYCLTL